MPGRSRSQPFGGRNGTPQASICAGDSSRNGRFYPTYKFADPHGTLFMGKSEISRAAGAVPGSLIEVGYNPATPNESLQVSSVPRTGVGCLIPFVGVFAVALFCISILAVG